MFLLARPRTAALFSHGVAGVLLAFAVLLKPTLGIAWPFVLLWLLVEREDTVLGKKRAAAFSLGMVSVITAVIFYFAELSLLGPFADATFAFGLRYSALSWLWVGGRLITFLLLYPPGRLVLFSIALAAILCIRKRDLMDRKYTLLVVFTLAALCSLVIQRRFAYYHSVPFCFFGSLFVLVGCRYFAEHIHKDSPSPGGRRWLIPVIVVVILFPFGRDLPLSALSCLAGQSTAAYGDQRRLERGLAPWSVVQEIGRAIRIGTPETASVLCLTGSDCPDFYLAGGRPPATKYVQPQHFGFDPMRQREAAALVANSCGVTAIVYNAATLPGIMDIYVAATKSSSTRVLLQRVVDNQRSFLVMSARRTTCPSETGAGSNSTIRGENASRKTGD